MFPTIQPEGFFQPKPSCDILKFMLDDCAPLTLARDQQAAEPGPKMLFFTFIFPGVLFHQAKPTLVLVGAFVGHSAWWALQAVDHLTNHGHEVCISSGSLSLRA